MFDTTVQLAELRQELTQLRSSVGIRRKELDRFMDQHEENLNDPFTQQMLPFLKDAENQVRRQLDLLGQAERRYNDVLQFYGEGPSRPTPSLGAQVMPSENFFGIFREFVTAYQKCKLDNAQLAQARRAEQLRQQAAEEQSKQVAENKAQGTDQASSQHLLDDILQSLQATSASGRRRDRGERVYPRSPPTADAQLLSDDTAAHLLAALNPDLAASTASTSSPPRSHRRARPSAGSGLAPPSPMGQCTPSDQDGSFETATSDPHP